MEQQIYNSQGVETSEKALLDDGVFNQTPHEHAMYQAVLAQQSHTRHGTHAVKNRASVRGGGAKPHRQKGTGRARAGTASSPLWVGGGKSFGPVPHKYSYKLPKKVKRLARISALSYVAQGGNIRVIEDFDFENPSTKQMASLLISMQLTSNKVLFVTSSNSRNLLLSCRNIPNLIIRECTSVSTYDILNCDYLLVHKSAIDELNKIGNHERSDTVN